MVAAVIAQGMTRLPANDCAELSEGKALSVVVSPKRPACVSITVQSGKATQVIAEHPDDLALRLHSQGREILADGFEFGQETITVNTAGQYRIEISFLGANPESSDRAVDVSRKALPLKEAVEWQASEALATDSKRSPKVPNILASLERWQALQDSSSIARTWIKLGDAVLSMGDPGRAHDAYERALEICHSLSDTRCAAEAANNSGYAAQQLGDLAISFTRLDEAAKGWQGLSRPLYQGRTLSNLGILYSHAGDFQRAISAYDRAAAIFRPLDSLGYAKVLNNLGLCYLSLAQYDQARIYFKKAIAAEGKLPGAHGDWLRARLNLGRTLMLQGRLEQARILLEELVAETEKQSDRIVRPYALNNLGQILLRLNLPGAAEARLRKAFHLHRTVGDKRGEAIAEHYLGLIARKRGDIPVARELLSQALEIRRTCGLRDDAADSLFALAELELTAGDSDQAKSLAEEAIPLLESIRSNIPGAALRASFYARRRNLLDLLVAIAMRPGNQNAVTDGFLAAELGRSRSLLDILSERDRSSPKPSELIERQAKVRREINFLSRMVADESDGKEGAKTRLEALIAEDQQVEARIRASIEDREPGARPLSSLRSLQQEVLSPQTAILEYQLGESRSYLWLVRDQKIEVFPLPARSVIERRISVAVSLFGKIQERRSNPAVQDRYVKAMQRLSATLLGSLQPPALPPLLILVLDGDLHRVPFSALRLSTGEYLGFRHDLVCAPSAAFLQQSRQQEHAVPFPRSILAFYDPVFSAGDPRVPQVFRKPAGTKTLPLARLPFDDELQTITRLVPKSRRDLRKGFDANARTLESLPLDQYGILHLSTHAVVNEEIPELSRIALSAVDREGRPLDGFLFPYQLANLHLRHSTVVLSACETALGKKILGEGLAGFASSFFSAGASQLVLTVSTVDAQASSVFLSETYARVLASHPESMEHALTLARRSFLRSDRWSDPYYWASFVVIGIPTLHISEPDAPR
jgi:CHAT domain-containing protein/Tfp pilus assembly protein PilF